LLLLSLRCVVLLLSLFFVTVVGVFVAVVISNAVQHA
jgi:hypothetical protein